jgi:hypothetical protein
LRDDPQWLGELECTDVAGPTVNPKGIVLIDIGAVIPGGALLARDQAFAECITTLFERDGFRASAVVVAKLPQACHCDRYIDLVTETIITQALGVVCTDEVVARVFIESSSIDVVDPAVEAVGVADHEVAVQERRTRNVEAASVFERVILG